MTIKFEEICRGPAVIVDDELEEASLQSLCTEITSKNVPLIKYESIKMASDHVQNLVQANFVILDWDFKPVELAEQGVGLGAAAEKEQSNLVIEFIKQIQAHSGAPIFIVSKEDSAKINAELTAAGISGVFVGTKEDLKKAGVIISTIEKWVNDHSHVYLFKWWSNAWNARNVALFWELLKADPHWPNIFFKTFVEDGVDPGYSILQTLNQLIFGSIGTKGLSGAAFEQASEIKLEALKRLYKSLHYSPVAATDDPVTGDIYCKNGKYYLNIRPDCDCVDRQCRDPKIYLLEGKKKTADLYRSYWSQPSGTVNPRVYEIIMFHLEGNDIVVFNKREMAVENFSDWKQYRVCRVSPEYVGSVRHSFSHFIGRVGHPAYPKALLEDVFKSAPAQGGTPGQAPAKPNPPAA